MSGGSSEASYVLFDWNGTLVDDAERAWDAALATLEAVATGHPLPTRQQIAAAWRLPVTTFFEGLGVTHDQTRDAERRWNIEMVARRVRRRPDAQDVLRLLRETGVRTGIISGAAPMLVMGDLASCGLGAHIDHLHAGIEDKASILTFYVASSAAPVLFVGDSIEDIEAAVRAGAVPLGVTGGYRSTGDLQAAGAHAVLRELTELLDPPWSRPRSDRPTNG